MRGQDVNGAMEASVFQSSGLPREFKTLKDLIHFGEGQQFCWPEEFCI